MCVCDYYYFVVMVYLYFPIVSFDMCIYMCVLLCLCVYWFLLILCWLYVWFCPYVCCAYYYV